MGFRSRLRSSGERATPTNPALSTSGISATAVDVTLDAGGGPANDPLNAYPVTVEGEVGRVDLPLAHAVQGA